MLIATEAHQYDPHLSSDSANILGPIYPPWFVSKSTMIVTQQFDSNLPIFPIETTNAVPVAEAVGDFSTVRSQAKNIGTDAHSTDAAVNVHKYFVTAVP